LWRLDVSLLALRRQPFGERPLCAKSGRPDKDAIDPKPTFAIETFRFAVGAFIEIAPRNLRVSHSDVGTRRVFDNR